MSDVLVAQGDLPAGLTAYRKGLGTQETLAARDPANAECQHDLLVSHEKIGDVLVAQGDLPGALDAYRKGLGIASALAARDPANTGWQRDLAAGHGRIGNVLVPPHPSWRNTAGVLRDDDGCPSKRHTTV